MITTVTTTTTTIATNQHIHRPLDACHHHRYSHLHHHDHHSHQPYSRLTIHYLGSSRSWPTPKPLDERTPQRTEGWALRRGPEVRGHLSCCHAASSSRCHFVSPFRSIPHTSGLRRLSVASDMSGSVILRRSEGEEAQKGRVKGGKERRRSEDEERVDGG
jgi:hypothetical protein